MGRRRGGASRQQPPHRRGEAAHLVVGHPERFQVAGLCARNHFNAVNLFHVSEPEQDAGFPRFDCHRALTGKECLRKPSEDIIQIRSDCFPNNSVVKYL